MKKSSTNNLLLQSLRIYNYAKPSISGKWENEPEYDLSLLKGLRVKNCQNSFTLQALQGE